MTKTFDVLQPIYNQFPSDKHLSAAVDAASLAFFSFHDYDTGALDVAQQKYSSALRLLNKAIQISDSATSDTTLLTVFLLDLYENSLRTAHSRSLHGWATLMVLLP